MRDRADAMEGMMAAGQLTDQFEPRSDARRLLAMVRAASTVDDDLARPKAEAPKAPKPSQ